MCHVLMLAVLAMCGGCFSVPCDLDRSPSHFQLWLVVHAVALWVALLSAISWGSPLPVCLLVSWDGSLSLPFGLDRFPSHVRVDLYAFALTVFPGVCPLYSL